MRLARLHFIAALALALPLFAGSHTARSYVLRLGDTTCMSGDGMSMPELKSLQKAYGKRFLWFRFDGRTYVTVDEVALDRAAAITRPQADLGSQQAALGQKQAELGEAQAKLGTEQAAIGLQQANLNNASDAAIERLVKKQEDLSRRQDELSKRQDELSERQNKMSEKQDELSREVEKKLAVLAEQLVRSGAAKEVSR